MTIGSLFSGIGGLEKGLEMAGLGPVLFQCEIDPFCRQILEKHWPEARRFTDVRSVAGADLPAVRVLCGGFPCQNASSANHHTRTGLAGDKSGLWFEYLRIVSELRPPIVVCENVHGLRLGCQLDTVAEGLDGLGYDVDIAEFEASVVGAPFRGARIFLVGKAHAHSQPAHAVDAEVARMPADAGDLGHWRVPFTGAGRVADRVSTRVERARTGAHGNAVVPQMAYLVGLHVLELLGGAA